ncbi:hypothetical protein ACET3Z_005356 [Daucus carota]
MVYLSKLTLFNGQDQQQEPLRAPPAGGQFMSRCTTNDLAGEKCPWTPLDEHHRNGPGSGAYSSEENNDTPTSDEFEPIRPKGTKAAKRKGKGNATAAEVEEYEAFEANDLRKITIMETVNEIRQKDIETRQRELEAKQAEMDLQVVLAILEK